MRRVSTNNVHRFPHLGGILAGAAVCIAAAGCMGSWAMRGTRVGYNKSVSHTASQEMLLNIVRMRYGETPTFLDMPSVVSQTEASMVGGGEQKEATQGLVEGAFNLRDRPTITYSPRTGDDMATSMVKPLRAEAILDVSPGNDTRVFLMAFVDSMNGVRNSPLATSPASRVLEGNDEYRHAIELFVGLQNRGAVKMRVAEVDENPQGSPLPAKHLIATDLLAAAENDYVFQMAGDQAVLLERSRFLAMVIKPEALDAADVQELAQIFRLEPGRTAYRVKSQEDDEVDLDAEPSAGAQPIVVHAAETPPAGVDVEGIEILPLPTPTVVEPAFGPDAASAAPRDVLSINVRSGYQVLAFLSKGVEVPESHVRRGSAPLYKTLDGRPFDGRQLTRGLFRVCVQKHRPLWSDTAVYYRGHWFYIPEDDVQSRVTLNLVKLFIDIRSEAGQTSVLTLPVN
ncbi:MAG TPA: hypothetical protein DC048_13025 [Planctomycetaceae bacterium]|nr:hypothetical protein [Planctomycetaceae bacterium]